jgi:hypothetical protein
MIQFQLKQKNLKNRNYDAPSLEEGFYLFDNNLQIQPNKRRPHLLFEIDNTSCLFDP